MNASATGEYYNDIKVSGAPHASSNREVTLKLMWLRERRPSLRLIAYRGHILSHPVHIEPKAPPPGAAEPALSSGVLRMQTNNMTILTTPGMFPTESRTPDTNFVNALEGKAAKTKQRKATCSSKIKQRAKRCFVK